MLKLPTICSTPPKKSFIMGKNRELIVLTTHIFSWTESLWQCIWVIGLTKTCFSWSDNSPLNKGQWVEVVASCLHGLCLPVWNIHAMNNWSKVYKGPGFLPCQGWMKASIYRWVLCSRKKPQISPCRLPGKGSNVQSHRAVGMLLLALSREKLSPSNGNGRKRSPSSWFHYPW